jgi:hypothetical protein
MCPCSRACCCHLSPPLLLCVPSCSSNPAAPAKKSKRSSLQAIREGAVVRTYVQQQRNLINQPARFLAQHRVSDQGAHKLAF